MLHCDGIKEKMHWIIVKILNDVKLKKVSFLLDAHRRNVYPLKTEPVLSRCQPRWRDLSLDEFSTRVRERKESAQIAEYMEMEKQHSIPEIRNTFFSGKE